jgi:hypothetical protein
MAETDIHPYNFVILILWLSSALDFFILGQVLSDFFYLLLFFFEGLLPMAFAAFLNSFVESSSRAFLPIDHRLRLRLSVDQSRQKSLNRFGASAV